MGKNEAQLTQPDPSNHDVGEVDRRSFARYFTEMEKPRRSADENKAVLILRQLDPDHWSQRRIAEVLKLPQSTVCRILAKAQQETRS